jgi:hypothetical protein
MRQADFKNMAPQIQGQYQNLVAQYEQIQVKQQEKLMAAKDGYIPTGGYLVVCDLYVPAPTPGQPEKTQRARIPYESLSWLIKRLEAQGASLEELEKMNQGAMAQMADHLFQNQSGGPPNGMGGSQVGKEMPQGVGNVPRFAYGST